MGTEYIQDTTADCYILLSYGVLNTTSALLFFFRTAFFINVFPQTRGKREKLNWQNMFPADALCAYSTVSLSVSLSSLRIVTRVSLSTGVGNSSYCT